MSQGSNIQILFCADTHLGFDMPVRPRVERRRRGPDFFANYQKILETAIERQVNLVIHGGDFFFRSKVPDSIVARAYDTLFKFADHRIPIVIVPGNHERSQMPISLFLGHPGIHILTKPQTIEFIIGPNAVAVTGFPNVRGGIRNRFKELLIQTEWEFSEAEVHLLCLHQAIEGAQVGPSNFTFRTGDDVIQRSDLPENFDAVLSGHIHRHQILNQPRQDGTTLPICYPGSTERTSFAERDEEKGFYIIHASDMKPGVRAHLEFEFIPLPARPMVDLVLEAALDPTSLESWLRQQASGLPKDAILRLKAADGLSPAVRAAVTGELLRRTLPSTMNVQFGAEFHNPTERT